MGAYFCQTVLPIRSSLANDFTSDRHRRKGTLAALFTDFNTVPAALKLLAERSDVFTGGIEHEDRRMILEFFSSFVDHIQIARFVDRPLCVVCQVNSLGSLGKWCMTSKRCSPVPTTSALSRLLRAFDQSWQGDGGR